MHHYFSCTHSFKFSAEKIYFSCNNELQLASRHLRVVQNEPLDTGGAESFSHWCRCRYAVLGNLGGFKPSHPVTVSFGYTKQCLHCNSIGMKVVSKVKTATLKDLLAHWTPLCCTQVSVSCSAASASTKQDLVESWWHVCGSPGCVIILSVLPEWLLLYLLCVKCKCIMTASSLGSYRRGRLFSVCFNAQSLEKGKSSLLHSHLQKLCRW